MHPFHRLERYVAVGKKKPCFLDSVLARVFVNVPQIELSEQEEEEGRSVFYL